MEKKEIINKIIDICQKNNWTFEKNVKTDNWKADLVVSYINYKVAFTIGKRPSNIEGNYQAMRQDKVCGCWLIIPAINPPYIDHTLPCFELTEEADKIMVLLNKSMYDDNGNKLYLELEYFTNELICGRIRHCNEIAVKYAHIKFVSNTCWSCGANNFIYNVESFISADGRITSPSVENITYQPYIIEGVRNFIKEHPQYDIKIGAIKERFSRTVNKTYMSFGCYQCDALFGNFFINDVLMDAYYSKGIEFDLDISNQGIKAPASFWYQIKNNKN